VIAQGPGADPASVIFDAYAAAAARGCDILIADTAGRLHTQGALMGELSKIRRVLGKHHPEAPHETLLVLDSTMGQNAVQQARLFNEAAPLTSIVLTKLDGTAKGGIVLAIEEEFGVPVKLVGLGEGADDLVPFVPAEFAAALVE
jgi:fused signal recognition particle receptor